MAASEKESLLAAEIRKLELEKEILMLKSQQPQQSPVIVNNNNIQQGSPALMVHHFPVRRHRVNKDKGTAKALCLIGGMVGICGLHRFYLEDSCTGIMQLGSLGCLGVWSIYDLVHMDQLVDEANGVSFI